MGFLAIKLMKKTTIILKNNLKISFICKYRRDFGKENWHYYEDDKGNVYHIKDCQVVAVLEGTNHICEQIQ